MFSCFFFFCFRWPWIAPWGNGQLRYLFICLFIIDKSQYLSWITAGTGVVFAIAFYIGTKERRNCVRKSSKYMDLGVSKKQSKLSISLILSNVSTFLKYGNISSLAYDQRETCNETFVVKMCT